MNADERTPGQQGYGQQSPQDQQLGGASGGQASYGNSAQSEGLAGDDGVTTDGQQRDQNQQQGGSGLFSGSDDDLGETGQDFASDGEGALEGDDDDEDLDVGTDDIESERSQGRESGIAGEGL